MLSRFLLYVNHLFLALDDVLGLRCVGSFIPALSFDTLIYVLQV